MTLRGLYAITPEALAFEALSEKVSAALEGGIVALQYRRKGTPPETRRTEANALRALCRGRGALFIVNDDVELALQTDADGVHLGREDAQIAGARTSLGAKLIGASCYNELERAKKAVREGADYVAFGSVFHSPTKPAAVRAPLSLFREPLGVPLCAIGGITIDNARQVVAAGADLLAVISDLFEAPDVRLRALQYGRLFA